MNKFYFDEHDDDDDDDDYRYDGRDKSDEGMFVISGFLICFF